MRKHLILCDTTYNNLTVSWQVKYVVKYRKIPVVSPGLILVQKALLVGLFSGELIFEGPYYWREYCVGLNNRNGPINE